MMRGGGIGENQTMCLSLKMIVDFCPERYLAICEHGTLHLVWQSDCFHLSVWQFWDVAQFVTRAQAELYEQKACQATNHLALWNRWGYVQLWLFGVSLLLLPEEFEELVQMVRLGREALLTGAGNCLTEEITRAERFQKVCAIPTPFLN